MKTISLISQLFQGYYSPDASHVLRRIDNTTDRIGTELISGTITEITPTATSSNGKTVKIQVLLALENVWQTGIELSSGETWIVPSGVTFDTVILRLAYSDSSRITVGQITQLNVSYDGTLKLPWKMDGNSHPTRDDFLDLPATAMSPTYPDALWRIDEGFNDGLPYNMLLPFFQDSRPTMYIGDTPVQSLYVGDNPILHAYIGNIQIF